MYTTLSSTEYSSSYSNLSIASSPLITFYDESYGDLDFTADLTAFTDEYSDRVIQVRLWFNPA